MMFLERWRKKRRKVNEMENEIVYQPQDQEEFFYTGKKRKQTPVMWYT